MSDLHDALAHGEPSEALRAMRAVLTGALLDVEPKDRPGVVKQMMAVIEAQQAVAEPEASASDDLARQRQARRAAAQGSASA